VLPRYQRVTFARAVIQTDAAADGRAAARAGSGQYTRLDMRSSAVRGRPKRRKIVRRMAPTVAPLLPPLLPPLPLPSPPRLSHCEKAGAGPGAD